MAAARRLGQLDLALDAEISTKHLSFLETGRAQPSRDMVLRLAERLDVPLRAAQRAAGVGRATRRCSAADARKTALQQARSAVRPGAERSRALSGACGRPALDPGRAQRRGPPLIASAAPKLMQPPVNVLRLSLHPEGLAPRIENLAEWRPHLLAQLRQQIDVTADPC